MKCKIILNKENRRYNVGETLSGAVEINNPENTKIQSICVQVNGNVNVYWEEEESYREKKKTTYRNVAYESHEDFINHQTILYGTNGETSEFKAGLHSYNFECLLPDKLPANMEGKFGLIKYSAKLIIKLSESNSITEEEFFVISNSIDLSQHPSLLIPVQIEEVKKFWVYFCGSNKVRITVSIPKSGFEPTENIPISCTINNSTKIEFEGILFKLVKIVTFKSAEPKLKERDTPVLLVEKLKRFRTNSTKRKIFSVSEEIQVPFCPVSCYVSNNIHTDYQLQLTFAVLGAHSNINLNIPIIIGLQKFPKEPQNDNTPLTDNKSTNLIVIK